MQKKLGMDSSMCYALAVLLFISMRGRLWHVNTLCQGKAEGHKLFLNYWVLILTFGQIGGGFCFHGVLLPHRRMHKGCTCSLLVPELTSHFSSQSFVWSHPELWCLVLGVGSPACLWGSAVRWKSSRAVLGKPLRALRWVYTCILIIMVPCSPLVRAVFGGDRGHHSSRATRPVQSTFPVLPVRHTSPGELGGESGARGV